MIMNTKIKYIGKAEYCYSNSTAMLLASIGESISPNKIEVLSGIGLGVFLDENSNSLFFSNLCAEPDEGISRALNILGFSYDEKNSEDSGNPPFDELRKVLASGPAVLGPLDLGLLVYNPSSTGAIGADHFVLAHAMDNERVYINDPYGFPQVSLTIEQLKEAWRADKISYKRGYYRFWTNPRRIKSPTEKEIYESAMETFVELYEASRAKAKKNKRLIGSEAIIHEVDRIRQKIAAPDEIGFLTGFMLPMSASRALDYAEFFDAYNSKLAELKRNQAALFGKAQVLAVGKDWENFYTTMTELAKIEDSFGKNF